MPQPRRGSVSASAEPSRRPGRRGKGARVAAGSPRIASFAKRLIDWQRVHGRHDLPWQHTRDAYRIWLSEVMLQQTQVTAVAPYYRRFTAAFPDVSTLADASLTEVLAHWSGLGYYRRAHHLHAAARKVMTGFGGRFPTDASTLRTLPGIGRSTAAAIAVFASGERAAILDGNVKRVLARHRGIDGWLGSREAEARLWEVAEALLPRGGRARGAHPSPIAAYTQGLMDLGASICTRTSPRCRECPVAGDCVARGEGRIAGLPARKPPRARPARALRVLIVERGGRVALERRPATGVWAGLWSFPELALDDDVGACVLARFGVAPARTVALEPLVHGFTHFVLTLHPLRVHLPPAPMPRVVRAAQPKAEEPPHADELSWLAPRDAIDTALPAPIRKLVLREAGVRYTNSARRGSMRG